VREVSVTFVGGVTETLVDAVALVEPAPEQLKLKIANCVSGPTSSDPVVGLAPDHSPLAVQALAFVEDQVRVTKLPAETDAALALIDTVGVRGGEVVPRELPPPPHATNPKIARADGAKYRRLTMPWR
jgi:hypothetical protein